MIYAVSRRSHFVDLIHDLTHLYLLNVTQEDLKRIILKYESLIKSKRVSSYILSVGDLLAVLEARNEISEGSVEVLKEIGVILQRPAVCERVEAYKTLITRPIPQAPSVSVASRVPLPSPAPAATNALSGPLDKVFRTLAEHLGTDWRDLGRNLGVKEQTIVQINARCVNDLNQSATQVLTAYWEQYPDANHVKEIKDAIQRMNRMGLLKKVNEALNNNHPRATNT